MWRCASSAAPSCGQSGSGGHIPDVERENSYLIVIDALERGSQGVGVPVRSSCNKGRRLCKLWLKTKGSQ